LLLPIDVFFQLLGDEVSIDSSISDLGNSGSFHIVSDVPSNAFIEENRFLTDYSERSPEVLQIIVLDVVSLHQDRAFRGPVETLKQRSHCRFAASGLTNQYNLLACLHAQAKIVQS
jgi:hypothetical protein